MLKGILVINPDGSQTMRGPITAEEPDFRDYDQGIHYQIAMDKYKEYLAGLPSLPALNFPKEDHGKVVEYETGWQSNYPIAAGVCSNWKNCSQEDYEKRNPKHRRIVAIPAVKSYTGEGKKDDPYSGEMNTKRIAAYKKLADDYNLSEGTVRDIFCAGIDWYKAQPVSPANREGEKEVIRKFLIDNRIIRTDKQNELVEVISAYMNHAASQSSPDKGVREEAVRFKEAGLRIMNELFKKHRYFLKKLDVSNEDKKIFLHELGISTESMDNH